MKIQKMSYKFKLIRIQLGSTIIYFDYILKAKNEVLSELDLSWNHIRLKGAIEIAQALGM